MQRPNQTLGSGRFFFWKVWRIVDPHPCRLRISYTVSAERHMYKRSLTCPGSARDQRAGSLGSFDCLRKMERTHNCNPFFENHPQDVKSHAGLTHVPGPVTTFRQNERIIRERRAAEDDMARKEFTALLVLLEMQYRAIEKRRSMQRSEEDSNRRRLVRIARPATRVSLTNSTRHRIV